MDSSAAKALAQRAVRLQVQKPQPEKVGYSLPRLVLTVIDLIVVAWRRLPLPSEVTGNVQDGALPMKNLRLIRVLVLVAASSGTSAAFAAEETFAMLKAQRAKGGGELLRYVERAGDGLASANITLQRSGREPLFCAPEDVRYADVALKQYQRRPARYTTNFRGYGGEAVVVALMDGLQRTYPCKP
jgi:hypothetical protein